MIDKTPKVFISYSWSNPKHKQAIEEFAGRLRGDGVDAVLDTWDLMPGQDKYSFMEQCVTNEEFDRVLIICDKSYKEKADLRKG